MTYFYRKKMPDIDEIVISRVTKISEHGIDVTLCEYNSVPGFINCGEISRKKKVNLNKLLVVGKIILLNVIRVDEEKNFIDLSKRTISEEDIKFFGERHKLHIKLYQLFTFIFMKYDDVMRPADIDKEELYKFMSATLWFIQDNYDNEHIIKNFLDKNTNSDLIDKIDFSSIDVTKEKFTQIINSYIDDKINRIKPEISETIKLTTFKIQGLDDIKHALNFLDYSFYKELELEKDFEIKILLESNSIYSIHIKQKDFNILGSKNIAESLEMIKNEIKTRSTEKSIQFR